MSLHEIRIQAFESQGMGKDIKEMQDFNSLEFLDEIMGKNFRKKVPK